MYLILFLMKYMKKSVSSCLLNGSMRGMRLREPLVCLALTLIHNTRSFGFFDRTAAISTYLIHTLLYTSLFKYLYKHVNFNLMHDHCTTQKPFNCYTYLCMFNINNIHIG